LNVVELIFQLEKKPKHQSLKVFIIKH